MSEIIISGDIGWGVTAKEIKEQFDKIDKDEDIDMYLSSPGGSLFEGVEIANMIRDHKGKVTLTIKSLAASMGSYISQYADVIKVYDNSTFMLHNPYQFTIGDYVEHESQTKILKSLTEVLSSAYCNKSKKSKLEIRDLMHNESFLFGQEIVDNGFADELIKSEDTTVTDDVSDAKNTAIVLAKKTIDKCRQSLKKEDEDYKFKIAAFLKSFHEDNVNAKNEVKMKLKDLLDKNPDAKKEYEQNIKAAESKIDFDSMTVSDIVAKSEKIKEEYERNINNAKLEASTEFETNKLSIANVDYITNVISSSSYGKSIKKAGIKVIVGKKDFSSFEDLVAFADEQNEKIKALYIQENQPDETNGDNNIDISNSKVKRTRASAKELNDSINNTENKVQ